MENCRRGKSLFTVKVTLKKKKFLLNDYFSIFVNSCFSTLHVSEFKDFWNNAVIVRQVRSRLFVLKAWRITGVYGSRDACWRLYSLNLVWGAEEVFAFVFIKENIDNKKVMLALHMKQWKIKYYCCFFCAVTSEIFLGMNHAFSCQVVCLYKPKMPFFSDLHIFFPFLFEYVLCLFCCWYDSDLRRYPFLQFILWGLIA